MCYKGFSIWAQAVCARPFMRPRRPALSTSSLAFRPFSMSPSNSWPVLYFQSLPTIKFCNSFLLITIQNAGGGWGPLRLPCNPHGKSAPLFSTASRMLLPQPFTFHGFAWLPGRARVPLSVQSVQPSREPAVTPFVLLRALPRGATITPLPGPCIRAKYWETKPLPSVSNKWRADSGSCKLDAGARQAVDPG
jgi:hypothetical protein